MADLGEIGAGLSGGLQGLVEAYKQKLAARQKEAEIRQSGFDSMARAETAQAANARGWASLAERIRANQAREGQGQLAINPITGERVDIPKGARIVTPPGAADAAKNVRTAENLLNVLNVQEQRMKQLPRGRVYGRGASILNKLTGWNPDVGIFQGIHEATIPVFSRVIGGDVGNLAEQEQIRAAKINPNLIQTPEEMAGVIAFTKEILTKKMAQNREAMRGGMFGGRTGAPLPAAGGDILDEFGLPD